MMTMVFKILFFTIPYKAVHFETSLIMKPRGPGAHARKWGQYIHAWSHVSLCLQLSTDRIDTRITSKKRLTRSSTRKQSHQTMGKL